MIDVRYAKIDVTLESPIVVIPNRWIWRYLTVEIEKVEVKRHHEFTINRILLKNKGEKENREYKLIFCVSLSIEEVPVYRYKKAT